MDAAEQLHKSAQAKGVQQLRNGRLSRWAVCPQHGRRSSDFVGLQPRLDSATAVYWVFRCKYLQAPHLFNATPDAHAPKAEGQIAAWETAQRAAQIKEMERGA